MLTHITKTDHDICEASTVSGHDGKCLPLKLPSSSLPKSIMTISWKPFGSLKPFFYGEITIPFQDGSLNPLCFLNTLFLPHAKGVNHIANQISLVRNLALPFRHNRTRPELPTFACSSRGTQGAYSIARVQYQPYIRCPFLTQGRAATTIIIMTFYPYVLFSLQGAFIPILMLRCLATLSSSPHLAPTH